MLTECFIGFLIDDIKNYVSFVYNDWDIEPTIMREHSGYPKKNPFITIGFLPTPRAKFKSISNAIGYMTNDQNFVEYGFCQLEKITIRCFANKLHKSRTIEGRFIVEFMATQIRDRVLKMWQYTLLHEMYASLDDPNIMVADKSFMDRNRGTMSYVSELDFNIRTQSRWNIKPTNYESKPIIDIEVLKLNDINIKVN